MSDDAIHSIDIREQLARIDRSFRESEKFVAEQRKLMAEAAKLEADARLNGRLTRS